MALAEGLDVEHFLVEELTVVEGLLYMLGIHVITKDHLVLLIQTLRVLLVLFPETFVVPLNVVLAEGLGVGHSLVEELIAVEDLLLLLGFHVTTKDHLVFFKDD